MPKRLGTDEPRKLFHTFPPRFASLWLAESWLQASVPARKERAVPLQVDQILVDKLRHDWDRCGEALLLRRAPRLAPILLAGGWRLPFIFAGVWLPLGGLLLPVRDVVVRGWLCARADARSHAEPNSKADGRSHGVPDCSADGGAHGDSHDGAYPCANTQSDNGADASADARAHAASMQGRLAPL